MSHPTTTVGGSSAFGIIYLLLNLTTNIIHIDNNAAVRSSSSMFARWSLFKKRHPKPMDIYYNPNPNPKHPRKTTDRAAPICRGKCGYNISV